MMGWTCVSRFLSRTQTHVYIDMFGLGGGESIKSASVCEEVQSAENFGEEAEEARRFGRPAAFAGMNKPCRSLSCGLPRRSHLHVSALLLVTLSASTLLFLSAGQSVRIKRLALHTHTIALSHLAL